MNPGVIELRDGIHWVGVKDWARRTFDGLIPSPRGRHTTPTSSGGPRPRSWTR